MQNYLPKEYDDEHVIWYIAQDKRGVMYFGVSGGLFEYDGYNWRKTKISDNSNVVKSLNTDINGIIYVGLSGDFGYFEPNERGKFTFISLINNLDSTDLSFTNVWDTKIHGNTVYLSSSEALFKHNKDSIPKIKK